MEVEESSSSDGEDFHPVTNRKHKKTSLTVTKERGVELNLLNNNKFVSLTDNNNNNNNAAPVTNEAAPGVSTSGKTSRGQKQPPLVVKNTSFDRLVSIMPRRCDVQPVLKLTRFGIKITCFTAEDFDASRAQLEKYKVEYYTYQRRCDKPKRYVVRGLPEMKQGELEELLKEDMKLDVLEVHAMRKKEDPTPVVEVPYVVLFPKGHTNLNKLREFKRIGTLIIRWEAYRNKKPHVAQCKHCLHLGHGATNCHLKSRCNKCGGLHKIEACKEQQAVRCANCAGAHAATDHSCPKRVEIIKSRQQASKPKLKTSRTTVPAFTAADFPPLKKVVPVDKSENEHPQPGAASGSGKQNGVPRGGAASKGDAGEALYSSAELWSIFTEFNSRLKRCMTRSDQVTVLGYMVCKYGGK